MTTQTREETARAFAAAMGWRWAEETPEHRSPGGLYLPRIPLVFSVPGEGDAIGSALFLPDPSAPLHEHLAFVGRVAEALGTDTFRNFGGVWKERRAPEWRVAFDHEGRNFGCNGFAPDLSWAAMLAAIEARKAR